MEALFVQLTDIHLKDENDFDILLSRSEAISKAIDVHIMNEDNTIIFLCVTGDLTYSGTEEQFGYADLFLRDIIDNIKKRYPKILVHIIAIPGNHDCNFDDPFSSTRDILLKNINMESVNNADVFKSYTQIQNNYFEYIKSLHDKENIDDSKGAGCENDRILTVNEINISKDSPCIKFHCINSAWCSSIHEQKGKMHFWINDNYEKRDNDIVVVLIHHDESWFDWEDIENWKNYYKKYADIVFVGHDHVVEYVHKENYNAASNYIIKGNQLYDQKNNQQSGFNILKVDLNSNVQNFFSYSWNGKIYEKIIDSKGQPFERNQFYHSGIELKKETIEFLDDMGIDLYTRFKDHIFLSDVFSYPLLRGKKIISGKGMQDAKLTTGKNYIHYKNGADILQTITEIKSVLICGEREYGKTALLKRLYKDYYDMSKLPVWLCANVINTGDAELLNDIVKKAYLSQYNNINGDEILQMESENKICIIDDFDEIAISDKSIKKLLQYLENKFSVVIIASTPAKRMVKFLKNVETNKYIENNFYEMQICELRSYGRRNLIDKWLLLADPEMDVESVEFDNLRKEKQNQIENVMKNGFFHRTPLEFLLVLSYLDNTTAMNVEYSRYSYIYDCLIKDKINDISDGDSNDAAMYQTILEQIAYKMYISKKRHCIAESFLTTAIYDYQQEYTGTKGEVIEVINELLKYDLMTKSKEGYRFKYDYMLYYFICGYIEHQISPKEKEKIIEDLLTDLTKELNYNIVLFLAFGSNIEFDILPKIYHAAENVLPEYKNFKYEEQYKMVKNLEKNLETKVDHIFEIPQNKDISEIQKRNAYISDMIEEQIEKDESDDVIEQMDKMTLDLIQLMRLNELLGDIIRNYAGKLRKIPRKQIIDTMNNTVMKSMGKMVESMEFITGKIMKLTEDEQKENNNDDLLLKSDFLIEIKNVLYQLWKGFITSNIILLAERLGSDRIKKEISEYMDAADSEFWRMVNVTYLINIQNGGILPVKEIDSCIHGNHSLTDFSQQILKTIVARSLCSYQFEVGSKQAVCDLLEFNIKDFTIVAEKNRIEEK